MIVKTKRVRQNKSTGDKGTNNTYNNNYSHPNFVRAEVQAMQPVWQTIQDCLEGELKVKAKGNKYLPMPNANDLSIENVHRYNDYKTRAVYYNATWQTFAGLLGEVFTKDPLIELPEGLQVIATNVDGSGIDMAQLTKVCVGKVLPYGRSGILVDYSDNTGAVTQTDLQSGNARATLRAYDPWDIINWRYDIDNSNLRKLSLVVLRELYILIDTGFSYITAIQHRVLRLRDGIYTSQIYRNNMAFTDEIIPTDFTGEPFNEILFQFIGAENNTADIDKPPMYDIASINIAHYRNSADYEESAFLIGQPTPYVTGLTESWVKNVLKGGFHLGSRSAIPLPAGATAGILVAAENGLIKEAMEHKERQMVAFGAKLVEQRTVQRTATEAGLEASAENSTLVTIVRNVTHGLTNACKWASRFMGTNENEIKFELNTDFALSKLSPDEQKQLIANWQSNAISWDEMRTGLRKGNIPIGDDKIARQAIDKEKQTQLDTQVKLNSSIKPAMNPKGN
jgi:hypothetical protein